MVLIVCEADCVFELLGLLFTAVLAALLIYRLCWTLDNPSLQQPGTIQQGIRQSQIDCDSDIVQDQANAVLAHEAEEHGDSQGTANIPALVITQPGDRIPIEYFKELKRTHSRYNRLVSRDGLAVPIMWRYLKQSLRKRKGQRIPRTPRLVAFAGELSAIPSLKLPGPLSATASVG